MAQFQSTLPGWGATCLSDSPSHLPDISIHAPRMGSDLFYWLSEIHNQNFNPRSPDGERQAPPTRPTRKHQHFNPRSPDGERLRFLKGRLRFETFQSTLPGWGATVVGDFARYASHAFQSTLPGWGATISQALVDARQRISIHAPRMGSDRENGHLRPRYGQNHPFSTLIVSQIVVDVLGTVRKSQKHQRTSHYEVIKQPERQK